ncbi:nitroreductase family deazaflavin-dependent oxidoreductase [Cellulomonas endometrii]|uniref:nitroreductase family deazaflavin-dependent oxidoreductase n=1 Tax=Cellulomonas endometrii TaxID=3036301 RepID=UPI0024AD1630|nr:nitroreductase family deazaflavin-dependent oxidoreductase [Cellulomonas endometrii]
MSFSTEPGTRGARQPSGPLLRVANRLTTGRLRRRGGRLMGMDVLVLHTVGARSGQPRATPVAWFPGPDGSRYVVASAAGAPGHPAWYLNIAAHPGEVAIEADGRTVPVAPTVLTGAERDDAWRAVVAAAPRFAGYQEKTDRVLPVLRLTPRD